MRAWRASVYGIDYQIRNSNINRGRCTTVMAKILFLHCGKCGEQRALISSAGGHGFDMRLHNTYPVPSLIAQEKLIRQNANLLCIFTDDVESMVL